MKNNYRLRLTNMQYFNDLTPPAPEGGDPSVTPPVNPVTPPATPPEVTPPAPVTFTQEQLDAAKAEQQEALLKQLGVENVDQLTQTLTDWKAHQETLKTDQEKQQEQLTNYQNQVKEQEGALFNLQAENAAIKAGITEEKNLNAVITLAKTKVNDDVDITKAIEMVVEEFPHFKGVVEEPPANSVKKPTFSNGQHQQTTMTESEKWAAAFGIKQQ
ncbi:hypothetical protein IBT50_25705 [Bacillus sp. S70]|uniref:hypothetical protein n=1 Tax=unclassified Bacillus (in: firmicutes) TaxID=185979 RepID=UPI001909580D|nr:MULTISPECIES: hypothetical protein [unclassified Bacillus (in: firmicutes)]MBJ9983579.1 hypothetical protein [Bacillus sp. S29]MBK0104760.1 hypothetical protein [Bacillus sp. S70]MBK0110021.1 hypothetical protein [Bacillus sp. S73]MBK0138887.1 hypothetical protein [Bacillus sp. S72]MBK0147992.1 hypothetical protein [Bacillus sp. S74]